MDNNLSLSYVEVVVTTKCTLKCKDCANLIQYYQLPYFIEIRTIKRSIERLLESVKSIARFRILGGETLLYPNLNEVVDMLVKSDKIGAIQIVTNGTIVPTNELLINALQNNKVSIAVSDYGNYSSKRKELIEFGMKHKIAAISIPISRWIDYGGINHRDRSEEQLKKQYTKCASMNLNNTSLLNGKLFDCPRSAHGMDLGIVPKNTGEYIDLIDESKSIDTIKKELSHMFHRCERFIQACNYCDAAVNPTKFIVPAIQINNDMKS